MFNQINGLKEKLSKDQRTVAKGFRLPCSAAQPRPLPGDRSERAAQTSVLSGEANTHAMRQRHHQFGSHFRLQTEFLFTKLNNFLKAFYFSILKSYIFLNKFVEIQKYKSGDLEGRRTPERGKGAVGSGDVRLFFFIIWFAQEMRASNDWKQLWAVTSGAKIEQQFLQMQPLKQLPQLFPTPLYTSPACSVSPPPAPPHIPGSTF